jgi:hypothetical protein
LTRIRFTIRDLLWLTAVAALAVGWCVDRKQSERRHQVGTEVLVEQANRQIDYFSQRANDAERKLQEMREDR